MTTYKNTCKEYIIDTLGDFEGQEIEISELAQNITQSPNGTGSWHCSTYKAQNELKAWFDDVAEFIEEYTAEFGEKPTHDAFTQPELFHCVMMITGVASVFNQLGCIQEIEGVITIDKKLIKAIITELKNN